MVDVAQEDLNGEVLVAFPAPAPQRRRKRKWDRKHGKERRASYRANAICRVAQAWDNPKPICHVCGCPHIEALTYGHPNKNGGEHRLHIHETGNSRGHRRTPRVSEKPYKLNSSGIHFDTWILKAPLEEIRYWNVRLECTYCNFYESKNGHYPEPDKRPQWPVKNLLMLVKDNDKEEGGDIK